MTALSMLNITKYPPSLLNALVTLGPGLLLLSAMERLGRFATGSRDVFTKSNDP